MNQVINNNKGREIVISLIRAIQENKQYLSDIDGLIGDGDHGINMNKGFTMAEERLDSDGFSDAFETLGMTLLDDIGGSMGPLYSCIFLGFADEAGTGFVDKERFGDMLKAALDGISDISQAQVGDKTLLDAFVPAYEAYTQAVADDLSFSECLDKMKDAAEKGRDATVDMIAKYGRASRLGERSRGVPDAGASSCALILATLANSMKALVEDIEE